MMSISLVFMIEDMLNCIPNSYNFLSNNVLINLNIQPSSLNEIITWTQLYICNIHKKKVSINQNEERNQSLI